MRTTLRLSLSRYGRSYATSQPRTPSSSSRPSARATVAQPSSVPVSRKTVRPVTPSSIDNTKPLRAERADTANEGNSKSLFQSYTSLSYSNKLRIWFGIVGTCTQSENGRVISPQGLTCLGVANDNSFYSGGTYGSGQIWTTFRRALCSNL